MEGDGVLADVAKAVALFAQAAEEKNARAQCMLGACYTRGNGVAKDGTQGFAYYKAAANQGTIEWKFLFLFYLFMWNLCVLSSFRSQ
jgi:TPR repeat protein